MFPAPAPERLLKRSVPETGRHPQYRLDKPQDLLWPVATQWLAIGVLTLSMALGVWQVYPRLAELSAASSIARAPSSRELDTAARLDRIEFEIETQAARIRQFERQNARPAVLPAAVSFGTRPRVRFVIRQGERASLAPGMTLFLERVDAAAQRISGSIRLIENGEKNAIRGLGVLETLHLSAGGQGYDLIITAVTADTATGYLVFPDPAAK